MANGNDTCSHTERHRNTSDRDILFIFVLLKVVYWLSAAYQRANGKSQYGTTLTFALNSSGTSSSFTNPSCNISPQKNNARCCA